LSRIVLETKGLYKYYDGIPVLKNASLQLCEGEILGVIGKNASAKSTFIKTLTGIIQPDGGEILIDGEPHTVRSTSAARQLGITALYDNAPVMDNMTVADNIFLGVYGSAASSKFYSRLGILDKKSIHQKARELCQQYHFSADVHTKVGTLSLAEKQMVLILKAAAKKTRVLLIDNCFTALDSSDTKEVFKMLRLLQQQGVSMVLISQKYQQILDISTSVTIIEDGQFSPKYSSPRRIQDILPKAEQNPEKSPYPKLRTQKNAVFFECRNLCYKNRLKDISFQVYSGEILGILGASGAGKSTLARALCGDVKAEIGKVFIQGQEVVVHSPAAAKKLGISIISDDTSKFGLIPKLGLTSNIALSNYKKVSVGSAVISAAKCIAQTTKLAARLGIRYAHPGQKVYQLSAGNRQKVSFARAIFSGARMFLLDEPTNGIDDAGRLQIYNIMNELAREGKSVVLFTPDMQEALGMCDRILVLRSGSLVCEVKRNDPTDELLYQYYDCSP